MKTYLDCIPCFMKQCLQAARITNCDVETQKELLDEVSLMVPSLSMEQTPPEMAGIILEIIRNKTCHIDPYKDIKELSSDRVKQVVPKVEQLINMSKVPLLTAIKLAIAANIIDYGANSDLDLELELIKLLHTEDKRIENENKELFNFKSFEERLSTSQKLLYIGDNVGEHFFDKLLINEIKRAHNSIEITYVTREVPVLNDITIPDAIEAGIDKLATVISSGSKLPGTVLKKCNDKFIESFHSADMIISKGQGNYETLSDESGPIFFLLMAKCPVIAEHARCNLKDILLIQNRA